MGSNNLAVVHWRPHSFGRGLPWAHAGVRQLGTAPALLRHLPDPSSPAGAWAQFPAHCWIAALGPGICRLNPHCQCFSPLPLPTTAVVWARLEAPLTAAQFPAAWKLCPCCTWEMGEQWKSSSSDSMDEDGRCLVQAQFPTHWKLSWHTSQGAGGWEKQL